MSRFNEKNYHRFEDYLWTTDNGVGYFIGIF